MMDFSLHISPFIPLSWIAGLAAVAAALLIAGYFKNRNGLLWRTLAVGVFMCALLNPSLLEEERKPVKDVAAVVADRSPSQAMDDRRERTDEALAYLKAQLENRDDLELRVLEAPQGDDLPNETKLFEALDRTLADVPAKRRAGVVFITDGQIHDIPANPERFAEYGPVHVLLSGSRDERDRQFVVVQAPAYGIVGNNVTLKYKIEDTENIHQDLATVTLDRHDGKPEVFSVPVDEEQSLTLPVDHAGQNIFELSAQSVDGEITQGNNRAAVIVNGVRDRLRVLLVSGRPHAGTRMWRDLLTADPGVDLVHFTILRDPEKMDVTPQNELSLIAFPFRELFEIKLHEFDLIVFDRYQLNRILPDYYFNNIARYVEDGGALLVATGPDFASEDSIYYTPLMNILPGTPTGSVTRRPFVPHVTDKGLIHPVTQNLQTASSGPAWGHWLRQADIRRESGDVLMNGIDNAPLLILDRIKEGRVAQIASDHLWLWHRGYEGGGPYAELLRRVAHWLMKEPELDERALDIRTNGNRITVRSRNAENTMPRISLNKPDGTTEIIGLEKAPDGLYEKTITADQLGIWSFEDEQQQRRFAVIGDMNPPELRGIKTTDALMAPLIHRSGGGVFWLDDTPQPSVRHAAGGTVYAGKTWLALRKNNDYTVSGVKDRTLLTPWLAVALLLGFVVLAWWHEGRMR